MATRLTRILGLVLSGVSLACGDKATTNALGNECVGNIEIFVSFAPTGRMPSFDWTPRCGISWLTVETVPPMGAMPALMWAIGAPESSPFKPRIEYGAVPSGATTRSGPATLVHGVTYKVTVDQTLGGDASIAHGQATFTLPTVP